MFDSPTLGTSQDTQSICTRQEEPIATFRLVSSSQFCPKTACRSSFVLRLLQELHTLNNPTALLKLCCMVKACQLQHLTNEYPLLTVHGHKLWKQQIQTSPNRFSTRNVLFIIQIVKLSVCTKRVENTHLASNQRNVKIEFKQKTDNIRVT